MFSSAPPVKAGPAVSRRLVWIDALKGAAILLVVLGHVWRGLAFGGLVPEGLFKAVDMRLYAFHMPVFFAASGFFLARQVTGTSPLPFLRGKVVRLLWPLVLWTYVFLGAKLLAGRYTNQPVGLADLAVLPVPGILHLWFLWALFLLHLLAYAALGAGRGRGVTWPRLAGLMAGALALSYLPLSSGIAPWIGPAAHFAPYLVIGMMLGHMGVGTPVSRPVAWLALLSFAVLVTVLPAVDPPPGLWQTLYSALLTASFILAVRGGAEAGLPGTQAAALLGAASMAIYVCHTIFAAALREGLLGLGVDRLGVQLPLGMLAGIAGPLVLYLAARRLGWIRALGF